MTEALTKTKKTKPGTLDFWEFAKTDFLLSTATYAAGHIGAYVLAQWSGSAISFFSEDTFAVGILATGITQAGVAVNLYVKINQMGQKRKPSRPAAQQARPGRTWIANPLDLLPAINGKRAFHQTMPMGFREGVAGEVAIRRGFMGGLATFSEFMLGRNFTQERTAAEISRHTTRIQAGLYAPPPTTFESPTGMLVPCDITLQFLQAAERWKEYGSGLGKRFWTEPARPPRHYKWWSKELYEPLMQLLHQTERITSQQLIVYNSGNGWSKLLLSAERSYRLIAVAQYPERFQTTPPGVMGREDLIEWKHQIIGAGEGG